MHAYTTPLIVWLVPIGIQRRARLPGTPAHWLWTRVVTHQLATLPLLAAGASTIAGAGGGLYWLAPGMIFSFTFAGVNSWVLLVEILR